MDRDQLPHLNVFAAVARGGGFRAAGRTLGLSPSAVSHSVAALEDRLGVRLFNRTTRSLSLTAAGPRLIDRLGPSLVEIAEGLRDAREVDGAPKGRVRITTPPSAALMLLAPHLGAFAEAYPEIALDIVVEDRFVDIVAERFDAGVRLGEQVAKDMIAVRIGPNFRMAVVGAPSYFAGRPKPKRPQDLVQHSCINLRMPTSGGFYAWEFEKGGREMKVRVEGQLAFNRVDLILKAAADGFGLACVPEEQAGPYLADGRLVRMLGDWCPAWPGYHLYYPSRRQMSPAFALLVEALRYRP